MSQIMDPIVSHIGDKQTSSFPAQYYSLKLLQDILPTVSPFILSIITYSLATGIFTSDFKHATVQHLLKKPNLYLLTLSEYEPISKICFLSKVLEKVNASQPIASMSANSIFNDQSGFRALNRTKMALLKVRDDLFPVSGESSILALLDLNVAFDTVEDSIYL